MLPDFLQSSYLTYKQDTDFIAKWLAIKAKQCGYPADLLHPPVSVPQPAGPSKRLKGAARKRAKMAAKENASRSTKPGGSTNAPRYTIKVKDFVALAECIAAFTKPVVEVPMTLVKVLNRAIELRGQHSTWSQGSVESEKSAEVEESNESHAYFLGILERTRQTLKPRMPSESIDDFLSKPTPSLNGQKVSDEQINTQISNMFDNLDIQEPSQGFLDAPSIPQQPNTEAVREPDYEAEKVQSLEEEYVATHCLFQDVRNIRSFLRRLWSSYRDGGFGLVAVSITTNTAIDFVRNLEQEFLQQFPKKSDYESMMHIFYSAQSLHLGHDPSSKQRPEDPFNFDVYDLAEEIMLPTYIVVESLSRVIEPDDLPVYKPGFFGTRDTKRGWTQKSAREKFHDDQLVLLEAFPDLMLLTMITSSKSTLAEDELIRGIRQLAPGKYIPLWVVFAAQCFLDAQHVLGKDVDRGHTEVQQTANAIRASIKQNLEFHQTLRIENWPRYNDTVFRDSLTVIEEWICQDFIAKKLKTVRTVVYPYMMWLTEAFIGRSRCDASASGAFPTPQTIPPPLRPLLFCNPNKSTTSGNRFCQRLGLDNVLQSPVQRYPAGEASTESMERHGIAHHVTQYGEAFRWRVPERPRRVPQALPLKHGVFCYYICQQSQERRRSSFYQRPENTFRTVPCRCTLSGKVLQK